MADPDLDAPSRTIVIVGLGGIQTDLDLDTLADAEVADVIPDLLADYSAECKDWTLIAREHWRSGRFARALNLLVKGINFFSRSNVDHTALVNLHAMLAHLHLDLARHAPKELNPHSKYDIIKLGTTTKEDHYKDATFQLDRAEEALRASGAGPDDEPISVSIGKIILYLARGQPGVAAPFVDRLLQRQPNNLAALTALARLQFARRQHDAALVTYQKLLALDPDMSPDPRIGLGLCAWILGDHIRARAAWRRAQQRDPKAWVPDLLIGLASLNQAREPSLAVEKRLAYEMEGVEHVQRAFRANNKNAASALALAVIAAGGGDTTTAAKLAERAIQYSDNRRHTVLANSERGRLGYMVGDVADAGPFIAAAKNEDPATVNMMAELTLAQIAIKNGNLREALNFVEQTAKRLGGKGPLEFTILHASLLAYPHLGMPADELSRNRLTARNMLAEIQTRVSSASTDEDWAKLRGASSDADIFIELAKLWQDESIEKTITSYQTAISIKNDLKSEAEPETTQQPPTDFGYIRLSTNLASLFAIQGEVETAERMYQEGLQNLATEETQESDQLKTIIAYDLGRASEYGSDSVKATRWYRDVLHQHPEHMESKVRLAAIASAAGRNVDAHNLLKECLRADEHNIALRSVYTKFLISIGSLKEALAFTSQTHKMDKNDVYTFTALGYIHFQLGREAKQPQEVAERSKQYLRSAEAYERALHLDPTNAVAAQGLTIALAEDTLTPKALQVVQGSSDELKHRQRLASQALSVFGRIKDSLPEGPVNVNIGHCYFVRGEEERAIEAYGAALNAYNGRNVNVLLYLCRAWYAYAIKESNFSAMGQALDYAQQAMHLHPSDRAILYNTAMIQQKAAEIMLALDPSKRTLEELQLALKRAEQAVSIFRSLADDKSGPLPYDVDLADQRARYGEGLLRKAPEQVSRQEAYESEAAARVEEARRSRAEEQARIEAAAAARQAEIEQRAAELAASRRAAREEARAWQEQLERQQAEDEARKVSRAEQRKRRKEQDADLIDDAEERSDDDEDGSRRKRKRKGGKKRKARKSDDEMDVDDEGEGGDEEGSGEDDGAARARTLAMLKAKRKKTKAQDPDEEDAAPRTSGRKFKSVAIIEDSDEDEDEGGTGGGDAGDASAGEASEAEAHGSDRASDDE